MPKHAFSSFVRDGQIVPAFSATEKVRCPVCEGTGRLLSGESCWGCGGSGQVDPSWERPSSRR